MGVFAYPREKVQSRITLLTRPGVSIRIFSHFRLEHLRGSRKMLRISGEDGPYGKPPKKSVGPPSRWLQAPLEARFALNERWFIGSH